MISCPTYKKKFSENFKCKTPNPLKKHFDSKETTSSYIYAY